MGNSGSKSILIETKYSEQNRQISEKDQIEDGK